MLFNLPRLNGHMVRLGNPSLLQSSQHPHPIVVSSCTAYSCCFFQVHPSEVTVIIMLSNWRAEYFHSHMQHVQISPHQLNLSIKYLKTDQLGKGNIITMGGTSYMYLHCCQAIPTAPLALFRLDSGRPLSAWNLWHTLHSCLRRNGRGFGNPGIVLELLY